MSDEIRVNGNQHSWGSIAVKFDGDRFFGFTAIGYADGRERVKAYGMGRAQAPRGRSRGKYTVEPVTLTGFKDSVQKLREALAGVGGVVGGVSVGIGGGGVTVGGGIGIVPGGSYGDAVFQIVVQYVEADGSPITVELEDCIWSKNITSEEEGPDPLKEDIEIDCMRIRRNGLVLFDNSEES